MLEDRSEEFEREANSYLAQAGHEKLKRRTFKLDVGSGGLEFFLYTHRETDPYYGGWFSADIGIRHPLAERFSWFGISKYAPVVSENANFDLAYDCAFRFSTAQIPGAGDALFDQKSHYETELARLQSTVGDVCIPELESIGNPECYYDMLIYKGEDEWYGADIYREGSVTAGAVVALGRMLGYGEHKILTDLEEVLDFFPSSHVGRETPSMNGPEYVSVMYKLWDEFR